MRNRGEIIGFQLRSFPHTIFRRAHSQPRSVILPRQWNCTTIAGGKFLENGSWRQRFLAWLCLKTASGIRFTPLWAKIWVTSRCIYCILCIFYIQMHISIYVAYYLYQAFNWIVCMCTRNLTRCLARDPMYAAIVVTPRAIFVRDSDWCGWLTEGEKQSMMVLPVLISLIKGWSSAKFQRWAGAARPRPHFLGNIASTIQFMV